jgi:two-component system phosphate regulon sensor histidine kinase PhoR
MTKQTDQTLHDLEKMRRDFVANVSHELRTPLTVMRGYLEGMIDGLIDLKNSQTIFAQMHQQTIRMEHIIADLLLLSRLETVTPTEQEQESIDIPFLLSSIQQDAIALSSDRKHHIHLEITGSQTFHGQAAELRSAFSNLLFNAVHYTPANGHIFVRWYKTENNLYFEVEDTGLGIEAHHIPRLTERFYRVDPGRTRQTGGTGLGLAIVKHVLLRHHAQLHIESVVGKGSIFRCEFTHKQ